MDGFDTFILLEGTSMASEWFYGAMGKQIGPVSSVELRNLAQRGTVTRETPVRKAPDGDWVSAEHIQGLFAVPGQTPPPTPAAVAVSAPVEVQPADSSPAPNRGHLDEAPITSRFPPLVIAIGTLVLGVVVIVAIVIVRGAMHQQGSVHVSSEQPVQLSSPLPPVAPKVEETPKPVAPKVEDKPQVPGLTLAKEYYFHGLKDRAKELLVNIVFASGSDKAAKAEALSLLGTISFEQGEHKTAFRDWERLCAEYPDSEQAREVKARLDQLKDVLAKISGSEISSVVAKSYLNNGDFWGEPKDTFIIDALGFPTIELAVSWYDRVIAEYPKSDAAELAYSHKLFTLLGREVRHGQFGPDYDGARSYDDTEHAKYMPRLIATFNAFEKDFPHSSSLQAFRYQIAQVYCHHRGTGGSEEAKTWLNKVLDAGGKTPTFYTEAAKALLSREAAIGRREKLGHGD